MEEGEETNKILSEIAQISTFGVSKRRISHKPQGTRISPHHCSPSQAGLCQESQQVKYEVFPGNATSRCPPPGVDSLILSLSTYYLFLVSSGDTQLRLSVASKAAELYYKLHSEQETFFLLSYSV